MESADGSAWFYNSSKDELFETGVDWTTRRLVPVGDELGWESPSAFARERSESASDE